MPVLHEYAGNMHIHTQLSDGEGSFRQVAEAGMEAGLDFLITTDHNLLIKDVEGYFHTTDNQKILLLTGEELHDMRRNPTANHLLVYNNEDELTPLAGDLQELITKATEDNGLAFIAHPVEIAAPEFDQGAIEWEDKDVEGFNGLEIWNYMSEFKSYLKDRATALKAVLNPEKYISGPFPEAIAIWDQLLMNGKKVGIIGNADAHASEYSLGPFKRTVFPYEYLFRCVNTHVLSEYPFTGEIHHDSMIIYHALRNSQCFVGYDLPASTKGFRFSAQGNKTEAIMGGRIRLGHGVTLQIVSPEIADIRLIRNGELIHQETDGTHSIFIANEPGIYRVEVYIEFAGKLRGWIFSNPITIIQ